MDLKLRSYLLELVGTFVLVFLGAAAVCCTELTEEPRLGVTAVALAEGAVLAVLLSAAPPVYTGYFNPAITITLYVFRRLEAWPTLTLLCMQLLGSALAGLCLRFLFAEDIARLAHLGAPHLKAFLATGDQVTWGSLFSGMSVELIFTFVVTLALFATLVDRRAPRLGGLGVGLAQMAIILVGFRLTGGAANPARWFGPGLWYLTLTPSEGYAAIQDNPVYWVGPILGALLGGIFATLVIVPQEKG
jgi:aquaporin Z